MCPQRTAAAISCCNLGQDTSTLCTVGFQKVVSTRCFWYVPPSLSTCTVLILCCLEIYIYFYKVFTHTHTHSSGSCNSSEIISSRSCCTLGFPLVARRVIIAGQSHWGVLSCARELCVGSAGNDYGKCKLKCSTQQIVKLKVLLSAFQFGIYLAHENNSIIAKWISYYGRGCSA